jgi:putative acetyltransferase
MRPQRVRALMIEMSIETPDQSEVIDLLTASDDYAAALYPAESNHMLDVSALMGPDVTFVVARIDGKALGCAALVDSGGAWAEIKRMFVSPAGRGRKIGRRLLERLESIAMSRGFSLLRLETGIKQFEALALYRSSGFFEVGPFGSYRSDPLSVFMEKRIGREAG